MLPLDTWHVQVEASTMGGFRSLEPSRNQWICRPPDRSTRTWPSTRRRAPAPPTRSRPEQPRRCSRWSMARRGRIAAPCRPPSPPCAHTNQQNGVEKITAPISAEPTHAARAVNWSSTSAAPCGHRPRGRSRRASPPRRARPAATRIQRPILHRWTNQKGDRRYGSVQTGAIGSEREDEGLEWAASAYFRPRWRRHWQPRRLRRRRRRSLFEASRRRGAVRRMESFSDRGGRAWLLPRWRDCALRRRRGVSWTPRFSGLFSIRPSNWIWPIRSKSSGLIFSLMLILILISQTKIWIFNLKFKADFRVFFIKIYFTTFAFRSLRSGNPVWRSIALGMDQRSIPSPLPPSIPPPGFLLWHRITFLLY